jgi:hypothetical protein
MPKNLFGLPAYDGSLRRRIRLLVKANPKRGKAALRFAKYRDGMTIEQTFKPAKTWALRNMQSSTSRGTQTRRENSSSYTTENAAEKLGFVSGHDFSRAVND